MRGQVKVTVTYLVETDTDWYPNTEWYKVDPTDSEEMHLVKGVKDDFERTDALLEELCVTGGMTIESTEFVKWLSD